MCTFFHSMQEIEGSLKIVLNLSLKLVYYYYYFNLSP